MNQLISGTIAGVSGILVGQPLDTIKVRLQAMHGRYTGPWHCAKEIFRYEFVCFVQKALGCLLCVANSRACCSVPCPQACPCICKRLYLACFALQFMCFFALVSNNTCMCSENACRPAVVGRIEGVRGFFRGMWSPIAANAPINAVLFMAHFHIFAFLDNGPAAHWSPLAIQFAAGTLMRNL